LKNPEHKKKANFSFFVWIKNIDVNLRGFLNLEDFEGFHCMNAWAND